MARMRRVGIIAVCLLVTLVSVGAASYFRARRVAAAFVGPVPADVVQLHQTPVSFRRAPNRAWGWAIAYGPRSVPGHVGFEIYVAPFGGVIGTNPLGLEERLPALRRS